MRLTCPHCGPRDSGEFTYLGDARLADRPAPEAADADALFHDYVYLRDNPAGVHRELWYHGSGCRAWLVATRDMRSHAFTAVVDSRTGESWREDAS